MDGIVNWRTFEKMTNWAVSKSDEDARRWDAGADGWQKRIDFEKKFSQAQVDALTRITKEDTVLDACCGTGRLTLPLARKAKHVYSVDAGERMLAHCRENVKKEGLDNVTIKRIANWHTCDPGKEIPVADIAVACISPTQADILKFSKCARKYCYSLSFTKQPYRFVMAELFDGVNPVWEKIRKEGRTKTDPAQARMLGLNVPFNLLYDAGANPEVSYVDGGWEHEAETRETLYEYLAGFGEVPQEKWERFTRNCDIRIEKTSEGTYRYFAPTQMYVLGWDPNQLSI
ncbi:MAG: class I SAM-dependent methyltransferase [Anaerovoracaceae bacterium]